MGWRAILLGVVSIATVASCGGDTSSPSPNPGQRGIQIVSGSGVTDSAGANLSVPLIVEIHDSAGARAPLGTVVRFESQSRDGASEARVAALSSAAYSSFASGVTDASGRTGVTVILGEHAGPSRIAIVVPTLGIRDTARFTITPGAAARVDLRPADTAVFVGESFRLSAAVTDRFGNARPDPLTLTISRAGATVSNAALVSTSAIGRYALAASALGLAQTSSFSVVPPGVLTAIDASTRAVVWVSMTGANKVRLAQPFDGGIGVRPRWVVSSREVMYTSLVGQLQTLYVSDSIGQSHPLFATRPSFITHAADPAPSADGAWVYFAAHSPNCASGDYCLHRAHLDGTSAETMAATAVLSARSLRPSPSPDGRRVVFQLDLPGGPHVRVLDTDLQELSAWSVPGYEPLWSPNGQLLAFTTDVGDIRVIAPDGTALRTVVSGTSVLRYSGIAWSPDSHWIMFHSIEGGPLEIVNVQTGERVPIPQLDAFYQMSWR